MAKKQEKNIVSVPVTGCSTTEIPHGILETRSSSGCMNLESIIIPDTVEVLGGFRWCTGLKEVVIPNTVKEIDNCAFQGCTGLKSIVIPESVKKIGWNAFSECTGLTHLTIPSSVRIDSGAFNKCTALKAVEIKGEMKPFPERMIGENDNSKF